MLKISNIKGTNPLNVKNFLCKGDSPPNVKNILYLKINHLITFRDKHGRQGMVIKTSTINNQVLNISLI